MLKISLRINSCCPKASESTPPATTTLPPTPPILLPFHFLLMQHLKSNLQEGRSGDRAGTGTLLQPFSSILQLRVCTECLASMPDLLSILEITLSVKEEAYGNLFKAAVYSNNVNIKGSEKPSLEIQFCLFLNPQKILNLLHKLELSDA